MDLIINSTAVARSSLGVRRFFSGVMHHLAWDSGISFPRLPKMRPVARAAELLQVGRRDAIFWSPTHSGPLFVRNHVMTIHDCINVEYVYRDDWRLPAFRRMFNLVLANARVVVTISRATKDAVLRNYSVDESKIVVIAPGFDMPAEASSSVVPFEQAGPPFILLVTNALAHKNAALACRAFANSNAPRQGYVMRVVGSLPDGTLGLYGEHADKIEVHARVSDAVLRNWYRGAAFLFGPSLAEGFNLPVAEAIANGGNVLCSNIPVHLEFFEGRADFFDPRSESAMIEALNAALMKTGTCWYQAARGNLRSFKDAGDEYRALFRGIARN